MRALLPTAGLLAFHSPATVRVEDSASWKGAVQDAHAGSLGQSTGRRRLATVSTDVYFLNPASDDRSLTMEV